LIQKRITAISDKKRQALIVSGYYGALLGALYAAIYFHFENAFPPAEQLLFVTTATFCAYFYQKRICFSIHYPAKNRIVRWEIILFAVCSLISFITFLNCSVGQQLRILALALLVLSYHNHSRFYFFRRLPVMKNLMLCATWILLLFWVFEPFHHNAPIYPTLIVDFAIVLFAQSMLCDWDHRREDLAFNHKTISNSMPGGWVMATASALYLVSMAILATQVLKGHMDCGVALAQIALYIGFAMFIRRYVKAGGSGQLFWTDVILLAKAVLYAMTPL